MLISAGVIPACLYASSEASLLASHVVISSLSKADSLSTKKLEPAISTSLLSFVRIAAAAPLTDKLQSKSLRGEATIGDFLICFKRSEEHTSELQSQFHLL